MSFPRTLQRECLAACRRARVTSADLYRLLRYLRTELKLPRAERRRRALPKVLTDADLERYYETVDKGGNDGHKIMLRLLFYTAIRVAELCAIKVNDVDLAASKIFIEDGKGGKDRYVLFPERFRLAVSLYLLTTVRGQTFLFESRQARPYSTRRIQQIMKEYAEAAGIEGVHPHMLRHQMLTWLTRQGLPDSAIQLVSGHSSKKSLEVYQHISLQGVSGKYQDAVKGLDI